MISLYRDEPMLQTPFRLLTMLVTIDENLALWRYRHTLMVNRMIGGKIGTGEPPEYHNRKLPRSAPQPSILHTLHFPDSAPEGARGPPRERKRKLWGFHRGGN